MFTRSVTKKTKPSPMQWTMYLLLFLINIRLISWSKYRLVLAPGQQFTSMTFEENKWAWIGQSWLIHYLFELWALSRPIYVLGKDGVMPGEEFSDAMFDYYSIVKLTVNIQSCHYVALRSVMGMYRGVVELPENRIHVH